MNGCLQSRFFFFIAFVNSFHVCFIQKTFKVLMFGFKMILMCLDEKKKKKKKKKKESKSYNYSKEQRKQEDEGDK